MFGWHHTQLSLPLVAILKYCPSYNAKCIKEKIFSKDPSGGKRREKSKHFLTAGVMVARKRNPKRKFDL